MDKYTKFILTIIAVGIMVLNIQLFKDDIISNANALESHRHYNYEIYGLDNHAHNTEQIWTGLDGDKKVLKDLLEHLINNSHTHFWN
tara:strand:- start:608 stop:868 length:261 start_codon:yes stop_codon:yes gene_type:complete